MVDLQNPPEKYWHCGVKPSKKERMSIVNDLTFSDLKKAVVDPWSAGRPFSISGFIVRSTESVSEIRIAWTQFPQQYYADRHNERMRASSVADLATDRRALVFVNGEDVTFDLLFSGSSSPAPEPDAALVRGYVGGFRKLPEFWLFVLAKVELPMTLQMNMTFKISFMRYCVLI